MERQGEYVRPDYEAALPSFVEIMRSKLRVNRPKDGWVSGAHEEFLLAKMEEEFAELRVALARRRLDPSDSALDDEIVEEAGDLANLAMILAVCLCPEGNWLAAAAAEGVHGTLSFTADPEPEGEGEPSYDAIGDVLGEVEAMFAPGALFPRTWDVERILHKTAAARTQRAKEREGERVVYVTPGVGITNVSDGGPIQSLSNDAAHCIFGDVPDGTHAHTTRRVEEKAKVVPVKMLAARGGYVFYCPACRRAFLADPVRFDRDRWPAMFEGPSKCPGCDEPWGEPCDLPEADDAE